MGIADRYPDWKEIDEGKKKTIQYKPEKPNSNGHVIPSLKSLISVDDFPKPNKNILSNSHSPPKIEEKYRIEHLPKSSQIETKYIPKNIKANKAKKPWWKFWQNE